MKINFATLFSQHLENQALTLRAFSQRVGVANSYIHRVKFGEAPPPLWKIPQWADALGLSPKERNAFYHAAIAATLPEELQRWLDETRRER